MSKLALTLIAALLVGLVTAIGYFGPMVGEWTLNYGI